MFQTLHLLYYYLLRIYSSHQSRQNWKVVCISFYFLYFKINSTSNNNNNKTTTTISWTCCLCFYSIIIIIYLGLACLTYFTKANMLNIHTEFVFRNDRHDGKWTKTPGMCVVCLFRMWFRYTKKHKKNVTVVGFCLR